MDLLINPDVEPIRQLIRVTARTSLLFFLMAYTAQALWVRWPGAVSQWLRRYRRQWGWSLVVSHTLHALGIAALALEAPALFKTLAPVGNLISGGLAYALLWSMGVTSFDRTARWLGPIWWSRLHTWGSHYLWLSFLVAYGKRVPVDLIYALPVGLLLLAMGLRLSVRRRA